jgi:adenine-specific DNA methylase
LRELNAVLPEALDEMTKGSGDDRSPVAPVDLSQAIIGPGMAVFSKYAAVLEADGTPMSVSAPPSNSSTAFSLKTTSIPTRSSACTGSSSTGGKKVALAMPIRSLAPKAPAWTA